MVLLGSFLSAKIISTEGDAEQNYMKSKKCEGGYHRVLRRGSSSSLYGTKYYTTI